MNYPKKWLKKMKRDRKRKRDPYERENEARKMRFLYLKEVRKHKI